MTRELPPRDSASNGMDHAHEPTGEIRLEGAALMSTALKLTTTSSPSAVRRLASDYREVQRRLSALSRIASRLPRLTSEAELLTEVVDNLLNYFDRVRLVEVFAADGDWKESRLYCRERDGVLRTTLCGGIDALPEAYRGEFAVPRIIAGDGARGPMMSAPVLEGVSLMGLLVIEAENGAPDFTEGDHDALAGVAAQVSMAIQQLRSSGRQRHAGIRQRDLEAARRIQRSFLPSLKTAANGFRIATEYRPAFDVGGDFYDVITTGPGQLLAVIGDVAGKGVAGALMMSRISSEIRRLAAVPTMTPRELLNTLNVSFAALGVDDSFVTAACVKLDKTTRRLTVANAGHVLPLVRRASGAVMPLGRASGPPVGMLAATSYSDDVFPLDAGDIVLLMTDGVLDALHRDDDQLGLWSIIDLLAKAPRDLEEINRRIVSLVHQRTGGTAPDDLTLLGLEVRDED
jgi:serine phosphatase RsbU (regulator of sigma subunit)